VFEEVHEIERQMHAAGEDLAKYHEGPKHDEALARYSRHERNFSTCRVRHRPAGGERAGSTGVGQRDLDMPIKLLSGGQKSRAQLARLLLEGPD